MFNRSNPYYSSQSNIAEPGNNNEGDSQQPQYFDPILNELAKYHPEVCVYLQYPHFYDS